MSDHRSKPNNNNSKGNLLHDLEDLSGMLDDDAEIERELTQPYDLEDLPVLKSFVEDVPTLNEALSEDANDSEPEIQPTPAPSPVPPTASSNLDDSFVDDDPLAISPSVRQQRAGGASATTTVSSNPTPATPPVTSPTAAVKTPPAATIPKGDNPFLPKSALEQMRNATAPIENKASQELRDLVRQRSLPNFSTNSKEYQALRNDASKMVNEVIRLFMPRMEAELRMRLEREIDEFLKELRKNAQD